MLELRVCPPSPPPPPTPTPHPCLWHCSRDVRAAALGSASFVGALSFAAFDLWHIQRVLGLARDAAAVSGPATWLPQNLPLDVQFAWAWDWDTPLQVSSAVDGRCHQSKPCVRVCLSSRECCVEELCE